MVVENSANASALVKANKIKRKDEFRAIVIGSSFLLFCIGFVMGYFANETIINQQASEYREALLRDIDSLNVDKIYFMCRKEGIKFARVAAIQSAIETDYYSKKKFKENKNLFNLIVPSRRYFFGTNKDDYDAPASFSSISSCIQDYKSWQMQHAFFIFNEDEYIDLLQSYSKDPNYAEKIRDMLDDYDKEY